MSDVIGKMLERYAPKTARDHENALKEILQEIVLLGLSRAGFFEKAAFYGGTALRIFHGLDRFSEDLDFTLLRPDPEFRLETYFPSMRQELSAYGFEFELSQVEKSEDRLVDSAFLKANTRLIYLTLERTKSIASLVHSEQKLKVKFEVDIHPATSFKTELRTQLLPSPFVVKTVMLPDLFAGKMHAALYRAWKTRVKGRDFYDLQWYIARDVPIRLEYLHEKIEKSGIEVPTPFNRAALIQLFRERILTIQWEQAKRDVLPFLRDSSQVQLWSVDFFHSLIDRIRVDEEGMGVRE